MTRTPTPATPAARQLDFGHARARARVRPLAHAQRAREHAGNLGRVADRSESEDPARAAALDSLKRSLVEYLTRHGIGQKFQAADFSRWLEDVGDRPDERLLDPRALGGLILHLWRCRIIERRGFGMTGQYGGAQSSMRPVYIIKSLDFDPLDWPGCTKGAAA